MFSNAATSVSGLRPELVEPTRVTLALRQAVGASDERVRRVLKKARRGRGLSPEEAAVLLQVDHPEFLSGMFQAAKEVKHAIYGRRVVFFAPLYFSNACVNNCLYCGFRRDAPYPRKRLSLAEIDAEVRALTADGHKRLLAIGGEEPGEEAVDYLLQVIETAYQAKSGRNEVRRINVETAPMTVAQFRRLKDAHIGTYVLFQETYDRETYAHVHPSGPKANYDWRLGTMDRAMDAGINDVGIGVLFGLHDYRREVISLLLHAEHLEHEFGAGPHTISVPRIQPAIGASFASNPPAPVSDLELQKVVAVLRLAVPYTGIILSTREEAPLRARLLDLGVSQLSAGSRTEPGGYAGDRKATAQFSLGDTRPLDEVIRDVCLHGYVPSFCTGCYRKGRTGKDFMDLAKPGLIRMHCLPNALLTLREFLDDYASEETRAVGNRVIEQQVRTEVPELRRPSLREALSRTEGGERDICY